jgi:hypothetical protein
MIDFKGEKTMNTINPIILFLILWIVGTFTTVLIIKEEDTGWDNQLFTKWRTCLLVGSITGLVCSAFVTYIVKHIYQ